MHHHDDKGGKGYGMIWMMIPCLLLAGIILIGGDKLISSKYLWLIVIGACVIPHVWMMQRGRGKRSEHHAEHKTDTGNEDDEHKTGGCCH